MVRSFILTAVVLTATCAVAAETKYPDFTVVGAKITPAAVGSGKLLAVVLSLADEARDVTVDCTLDSGNVTVGATSLEFRNVPPGAQVAQSAVIVEPAKSATCRIVNVR